MLAWRHFWVLYYWTGRQREEWSWGSGVGGGFFFFFGRSEREPAWAVIASGLEQRFALGGFKNNFRVSGLEMPASAFWCRQREKQRDG